MAQHGATPGRTFLGISPANWVQRGRFATLDWSATHVAVSISNWTQAIEGISTIAGRKRQLLSENLSVAAI